METLDRDLLPKGAISEFKKWGSVVNFQATVVIRK